MLPEQGNLLDVPALLRAGKPSPYAYLETHSPSGSWDSLDFDHSAAGMMYRKNGLALLIARAYDFEELIP